jgi:hypothetical protein
MHAATFEEIQASMRFSYFDVLPRSIRDFLNEYECGYPYDWIYNAVRVYGEFQTLNFLRGIIHHGE